MILCVTGPMASGKNFICSLLEEKGFISIDADLVAHNVIEECKQEILQAFSSLAKSKNINLTNPDGTINRRALGELIFQDKELVKKQEQIVYPKITEKLNSFIRENKGKNLIINATLLYKVETINLVDKILFVKSPLLCRIIRAKKRDGLPLKQIRNRFRNQKNLFTKYKKSNADIRIVWNIGSRKTVENRLQRILDSISGD